MTIQTKTAALIVAAGTGQRARQATDNAAKQYLPLHGEAVLAHTVRMFASHPAINAVQVVIHANDHEHYQAAISKQQDQLLAPVEGGATRQQSVLAGLQALQESAPDNVLIHDAVRPFVTAEDISRILSALETHDCVLPALPVTDTLKRSEDGFLKGSVDRSNLWRVQTPQGFRYQQILQAHLAAKDTGKTDFTDDSSIAEWHGLKVHLVEGSSRNIKLTTADDFAFAEAFSLQQTNTSPSPAASIRVGNGYDVHAFEPGDHVTLCGVRVPHTQSLKGHSDADVGLHALTDAILGALCDGDIGTHFPPSDPKWAGADSSLFLENAAKRVDERGGSINHVDITLICEAPKIGPHADAMRARVAQILNIPVTHVSIKATTTERLGFTGREEGIAAMATATLHLP